MAIKQRPTQTLVPFVSKEKWREKGKKIRENRMIYTKGESFFSGLSLLVGGVVVLVVVLGVAGTLLVAQVENVCAQGRRHDLT